MDKENKLIEERERAHLAQQITANPLWLEFFTTMESRLIESWKGAESAEYREDAWRYIKLLGNLKQFIEQTLTTGKMAEIALAEMRQERENGRRTTVN